jgi:hypothetical protein
MGCSGRSFVEPAAGRLSVGVDIAGLAGQVRAPHRMDRNWYLPRQGSAVALRLPSSWLLRHGNWLAGPRHESDASLE